MNDRAPELFLAVGTNPAVDRVARFAGEAAGVVKASEFLETPGGKAVHTAMVARRLGAEAALIVTAGGRNGDLLRELLEAEDFESKVVPVSGATRGTYTLVSRELADVTEVHEPSAPLTAEECDELVAALDGFDRPPAVVAVCGSLPDGAPVDLHARLTAAARERGDHTILDCSTPAALSRGLAAGPDLATPNLAEASRLLGRDDAGTVPPDTELLEIASAIRDLGARAVWLSLGSAGSVFASGDGVTRLFAPDSPAPVNAVGCGDALVGGYAAGLLAGEAPLAAAALGVAAATEKLAHLHPGEVDRPAVESLRAGIETTALEGARGPA